MATDVLGTPVKRTEDPKFITGKGRYLDDIKLQGMVHMSILRSPYAHANIKSIDTSAAKTMPGVIAVFVGADIPYNPLPMAWPAGGASGLQNNVNTPRVLATDDVKWTGEGDAGRHRGHRRRRHPVQPLADGLAGRRREWPAEQRQHAASPRH